MVMCHGYQILYGDGSRSDRNNKRETIIRSNLYISISIASLLVLTLLARVWGYGYNSILKTSINS